MSEEELKAIKHLKNYKYDNEVRQSIDIILNLIEKQQKQIEIKDKMIDLMAEKIFRDITDKKMKKAYGIDSKEDVKKMYFNILDEEF